MLDAESGSGVADPLIRILIIGGYGGFGARLTRRLTERGHHVLVMGRSDRKARLFCASVPGTSPVVGDREKSLSSILSLHQPDLVIDAAGPFQESRYHVPRSCIDHQIPYLDLADGRAFVIGIEALNGDSVSAGVPIVSGASSVPALSGAAARHLAAGMAPIQDAELAISASSRGAGGRSVIAAILSYVGRPIPIWRGGRWTRAWGWQELRRRDFTIRGVEPLRRRWLALADVPDHILLPSQFSGVPQVTFRAGTDLAYQTVGLWLVGWVVRLLRLKSARGLTGILVRLQDAARAHGSERSAMSIRVKGFHGAAAIQRRWTLIAECGDGPEIPTLAAAILAGRIAEGALLPGARSAAALLSLEDFEPCFASLRIAHETSETALPPPLYARVMGDRFDRLPPAVRQMHWICGGSGASGHADVTRGTNLLARLVASLMRFPPSGRHGLHVGFCESDGIETWTRSFGKHRFKSELRQSGALLVERFGPLRFHFELPSDATGLAMKLRRWTCFGIPLPLSLGPRGEAREWQEDGRFRFDVPIALPLIGPVVHYNGWLDPPGGAAAAGRHDGG